MYLYDIHTHNVPESNTIEGYNVISILNIYPWDYDSKKEVVNSPNIYFSCGIHPWYINEDDFDTQYQNLREIAKHPKCVAIGEVGLDKIKGVDLEIQRQVFEKQILLAQELDKPLIIHCVKAWDELIELYKKYNPEKSWIIHGFRGNSEQAHQLIHIGFKLSFGEHFHPDTVKNIPIGSLFVETDTSNISILSNCQKISVLRSVSLGFVSSKIENNIFDAFKM